MTELERLAGEYALGLLEGEELVSARARLAREPDFAAAVAFWEGRLAPLLDEVGGAAPDPALWQRIVAQIEHEPGAELVQLQARVRFWQRAAAGAAVAAVAALALVVLTPDTAAPPPAPLAEPLVASIPLGTDAPRLGVTYLPERSELLISASGLSADGVHDHELWLVPPGGEAQSLGVIVPGVERRVTLPRDLAKRIGGGSHLALTREPIGGKPANQAAGPVVAEGDFSAI